MKNNTWKQDLSNGRKGENIVIGLLNKLGFICSINNNNTHDIGFLLNDKIVTTEVKYDLYATRSGNIAIEYFNPKTDKPSGVYITKADLWAHIITNPEEVWLTSVARLKNFIDNTQPHRIIERGGDNNASLLLYQKEQILPIIFTEISQLEESKLLCLINSLLLIQ